VFDWDHNAYYWRLLLRQLPTRCGRVLDVGCGTGGFATRLAERCVAVDAMDRCEAMVAAAQQRVPDNVNCIFGDVVADGLPGDGYDAIVSIAALHHMPLEAVLSRLADGLRPGGVLAAIALPRTDLRHEWPVELAAALGHRVLGVVFLVKRRLGIGESYAKDSHDAGMPVVMDPSLSTRDVREIASTVLSGARVRRLLFWRYLLVWRKPHWHPPG
jgi:SAM-dependent methyltransferase